MSDKVMSDPDDGPAIGCGRSSLGGTKADVLTRIDNAVGEFGFILRGGFGPNSGDGVPETLGGAKTRTLVLIGSVGDRMWHRFSSERRDEPDPLDRWTERTLEEIAGRYGAGVVFPFQRPFLPFQRWLKRGDPSHASPLRLLIHPEYGLWHVLRAAFLFAEPLDLPKEPKAAPPCKGCADTPCMTGCPVDAFSARGLDIDRCAGHLASAAGADCMAHGCLARRACPMGASYRHIPDQAAFHMEALRRMHATTGWRQESGRSRPTGHGQ